MEALEDSRVVLIYREELLELMKNDRCFLENYLMIQSDLGKALNSRIRLLSYEKAEDRLFRYLEVHDDEISFNSVTELAGTLGVKRETLSRLLSRLQKEKKIARNGKRLKVL